MTIENTPRYSTNPDVSCREEGPDGALLFNPDTDDVLVINLTGLLIWRALSEPRSQEEVVEALVAQCNNVPEGQVTQDVEEFVQQLIGREFIGIYKEPTP
ncbi:MAG: PqqD family peptide modification chaperone [Anaerolineae bacterium]|nr:PqqD family peptide modification chaperone [Anaerolineae bacterium]